MTERSAYPPIRKRLIGVTPDGHMVYGVDGKQVRDEVDIDFALGANHSAKPYVPEGHVWVELLVPSTEKPCIVVHETHEEVCIQGGMPYEQAHEEANRVEALCRKGTMEGIAFIPIEPMMELRRATDLQEGKR